MHGGRRSWLGVVVVDALMTSVSGYYFYLVVGQWLFEVCKMCTPNWEIRGAVGKVWTLKEVGLYRPPKGLHLLKCP
jgi:hypothetical protein